MMVVIGAEVAGTWNALTAFVFPDIPVDSGGVPVDEAFDTNQIERVRERLALTQEWRNYIVV
jgi:hypothetical protein